MPQALTVKDWFMILDAQIRSSGLNVSLSGLYLRKFEDEDITMHTLPFLTEKDLIDMGVSKMGHRKLIMSSIAKLPKSGQSVFVSSAAAASLSAPKAAPRDVRRPARRRRLPERVRGCCCCCRVHVP